MFSTCLEKFLLFSSNFKLSSADCFRLDLSKILASGNGLNVYQKLKFAVGKVENIAGTGENAGSQHFLLFPQCFQKASSLGLLEFGICGKELNTIKSSNDPKRGFVNQCGIKGENVDHSLSISVCRPSIVLRRQTL